MSRGTFKGFDFFAFLTRFLGGRRGQKRIFINCGICYHVIPQNVLFFFQKNDEWVCFSEFSIFGPFYVHFRSNLTPKLTFSQNMAPILLVGTLCDLIGLLWILASIYEVLCQKCAFLCSKLDLYPLNLGFFQKFEFG